MASTFLAQNWGTATRKLAERVNKQTAAQIAAIINEARKAQSMLGPKHEACMSAAAMESDRYGDICKCYLAAIHFLIQIALCSGCTPQLAHSFCSIAVLPSYTRFFSVSYCLCHRAACCAPPQYPTFGHFFSCARFPFRSHIAFVTVLLSQYPTFSRSPQWSHFCLDF